MKRSLKLEQFKNKKGQWQARFVASNGKNLARSSDAYETQKALIDMLVVIFAERHLPDIFKDAHGKWRWRYTKNGDTLIMATECYNNLKACVRSAKLVLESVPAEFEEPEPEPEPKPKVIVQKVEEEVLSTPDE